MLSFFAMSHARVALHECFGRVRARVEGYGVRVSVGEVRAPNTGTFDGSEIIVERKNDPEMALFVLAHLFGHTVQWNTDAATRTIDARALPGAPAEVLEEARVYEKNASRLGLQLLHEAGVRDRDAWLSDWWASDWRYLSTYYRTGALPDWHACRVTGQPLLTPLAIPPFETHRFPPRYAF
jgi:hypothetical protein